MGRYYDGDIEGKFWFAVQNSDDGEHFGAEEQGSNYIEYYLSRETFMDVGIKTIQDIKKQLMIGKKQNHWDLWREWSNFVDQYQKDNTGNDNYFRYPQYEEWLMTEKQIGTGKPENSRDDETMKKKYLDHERAMQPIWELLARMSMGEKMKKFFQDNPDRDELNFQAEC